jgi:uncharacterized LabA/DUF88 family protein
MAFIDGENLVARFQDMVDAGRKPRPAVVHERDVFVWEPSAGLDEHWRSDIVRAHYYTSLAGDEPAVEALIERLKRLQFVRDPLHSPFNRLYPVVFKKPNRSQKTSTVGVQLATDVLSHVQQDSVDVVLLFTGDSDFAPVVRAIVASGKRVVVGAFSSGRSDVLLQLADRTLDLDTIYFFPPDPLAAAHGAGADSPGRG